MDRRLQLDAELRGILQEALGYVNIYFQPPDSVLMKYDCIRYVRNTFKVIYANDRSYNIRDEYQVTVISRDPDSELPRKIQEHFQMCRPGRQYMADNLYHFPFTIYY